RDARAKIAAAAAHEVGLVALELRASDIPSPAAERLTLARLLEREAVLGNALAVLDAGELDADQRRTTTELTGNLASPCVVLAREPLRGYAHPIVRIEDRKSTRLNSSH